MKKRIFKNWVTYILVIIQVLLVCFVSGDCEYDLSLEFMTKFPAVCLLIFNHILIARHTEFYTNGF